MSKLIARYIDAILQKKKPCVLGRDEEPVHSNEEENTFGDLEGEVLDLPLSHK